MLNLTRKILAVAFICALPLSAFAKSNDNPLAEKIEKTLADFGENVNIGMEVTDLKSGKVLFEKNADRYYSPASNQKYFVALSALRFLGPDYTYQTGIYLDKSKIDGSTLQDNVYLKFTGDPTFTLEQLDQLFRVVSAAGIKTINGSIVVDDTAFDDMPLTPGQAWDDASYCWGAPVNAIIIDGNCVNATMSPAAEVGQTTTMVLSDKPQIMTFINRVQTVSSAGTDCRIKVSLKDSTHYVLDGCMRTNEAQRTLKYAITRPRNNLQFLLEFVLKENHITTNNLVQFDTTPRNVPLFTEMKSPPVKYLVTIMMKNSDNMIADSLFKTMGRLSANAPGSFENGHNAVRSILQNSIQLDISDKTLIDGAGDSMYDYITPRQITTLLQRVSKLPEVHLFNASLPISGVDGTLKNRMTTPALKGRVFAKTGTATGKTSLSGYIKTRNDKILTFSIMINGFIDHPDKYKALEDKICTDLVTI